MMKSAFKLVYIENLNWADIELSFNSNDDIGEITCAKLLCFFLVQKVSWSSLINWFKKNHIFTLARVPFLYINEYLQDSFILSSV